MVGEGGEYLSLLALYVPGMQALGNYHDLLAVAGDRFFGVGIMSQIFSKSTIPPALYAVTWSTGYRDMRDVSVLANKRP